MTGPREIPMMSSERLAGKVLHELQGDLLKVQNEIVTLDARMERFGKHAMPSHAMLFGRDTLRNAEEQVQRERTRLFERMHELIATIEPLEAMMKEKEDADMEAFADFIRTRWGRNKR